MLTSVSGCAVCTCSPPGVSFPLPRAGASAAVLTGSYRRHLAQSHFGSAAPSVLLVEGGLPAFPSLLPLAVPHCCPCLREALEALVQTVNPGEDRFQGSWQGLQDPSPLGDSYSGCSGATASCFLLGLLDAMRCCGGGSRSAREPSGAAWGMNCTRSDSTPCEQLWWRQRSQKATWASSDTSDRAGGRHRG